MARTRGAPTHNAYSHFRMEEATIVDVNRKTWTVTVETRHSAKTVDDVQCLVPYHHYANGEGYHHLPEVGATCMLGWPNDNSSPLVMGYIGMPGVNLAGDGTERPAATDGAPSPSDVTYRSRRPDMNPGDIAITTRDENFLMLRRGGIVQIGATAMSQRIYIPVLNYIKDFCENYEMQAAGGEISWTTVREEHDPSGQAASSWSMQLREFAQDAAATVRVRHLPVASPGASKSAWEISVAPQGIDIDTGDVTGATYSLVIGIDGAKTEIIAAGCSATITGDDVLSVTGSRRVTTGIDHVTTATGAIELLTNNLVLGGGAAGGGGAGGAVVRLGSRTASKPAVLGPELVNWLTTVVWPVTVLPGGAMVAQGPLQAAALSSILSSKVFLE